MTGRRRVAANLALYVIFLVALALYNLEAGVETAALSCALLIGIAAVWRRG